MRGRGEGYKNQFCGRLIRKPPEQKPRSCVPEFTNAAYGVRVEATSTCGEVEREFCSTKPGSKNEGRRRIVTPEFVTLLSPFLCGFPP